MTTIEKSVKTAPSDVRTDTEEKTDETRQIGLKISEELLIKCDKAAKKLGLTRSAVIKLAVARLCEQEGI
jgi:hypothetical protein